MDEPTITVEGCASPIRFSVNLDDGRYMTINITHEGVIMDVFLQGGSPPEAPVHWPDGQLGTVGMTFDEWADTIVHVLDGVNWPDRVDES